MLEARAKAHYEARRYEVEVGPALQAGAERFRADLVVRRGAEMRLVRVHHDPLGTYEVGVLGARAKRLRMKATVICPATPELLDACSQFGVDHLSPEGLAEEGPVMAARHSPQPIIASPAEVPATARTLDDQRVPAWRWGVVAIIWIAAALAWTFLLVRIF